MNGNHVYYDTDTIISNYQADLSSMFAKARLLAKTPDDLEFINAQEKLQIARLEMERATINLINDGYQMRIVMQACGAAAGAFIGSKIKTARQYDAPLEFVDLMFEQINDAVQGVVGSPDGNLQTKDHLHLQTNAKPMESGRA